MNCKNIQNYFSKYFDGELDRYKKIMFEAHINSCSHCRGEYKKFSSTICFLDSEESIKVSDNFVLNLNRKLVEVNSKKVGLIEHILNWWNEYSFYISPAIGFVSAVILLCIIGWSVKGYLFPDTQMISNDNNNSKNVISIESSTEIGIQVNNSENSTTERDTLNKDDYNYIVKERKHSKELQPVNSEGGR